MKTHLRTSHPKKATNNQQSKFLHIKPGFQPHLLCCASSQARDSTGNQVNQGLKRCHFLGFPASGKLRNVDLKKGGGTITISPNFFLCYAGMVIKSNDGFYIHSLKKDMNHLEIINFPQICQFSGRSISYLKKKTDFQLAILVFFWGNTVRAKLAGIVR